jgi:hypothetical protein
MATLAFNKAKLIELLKQAKTSMEAQESKEEAKVRLEAVNEIYSNKTMRCGVT